ncbi:hypothetical protein E4U43_002739 [Claviceps pusilla]|uniref:Polycomb group protein MEDEA n=1 Tax=Claviceps pusilla TaxID=123648 RepID=A0A9P7N5U9_9HYPO|nr:hypothetical protein E4U43_002739 [Claviceps pusilla]
MKAVRGSPHLHQHPVLNGDVLPEAGEKQPAQQAQQAQAATSLPQLDVVGHHHTLDTIRPGPLRRSSDPVLHRVQHVATMSSNSPPTSGLTNGHGTYESPAPSPSSFVGSGSATNHPDVPSLSTPTQPAAAQSAPATEVAAINGTTAEAQTEAETEADTEWTMDKIVTRLQAGRRDIRERHARLTGYIIESTKPVDRRVHTGPDLFANIRSPPVAEDKRVTMRVKFKQHLKAKRDQREAHYVPVCTRTNVDRVPPYRFHHVEIKKNILTPNTMLTFVPHLKDLESSEETKYNVWLKELEDIDLKSGFKPMNREEKLRLTIQGEKAATLSLYLDQWLQTMAMPGCTKSALISYMAARESDDAITPRQKSDILHSHGVDNPTPGADKAARMFTEAFRRVFRDGLPASKQIDLRRVLMLDESVDNIMDSKPIVKDATSLDASSPHHVEDEDELAETNLATYCILGCLICYSHSCDHGEYDNKNMKRTFSMGSCSRLSDTLKARRKGRIHDTVTDKICRRQCYRQNADHVRMQLQPPRPRPHAHPHAHPHPRPRPWLEDERIVLRSLYTTTRYSSFQGDPICLAAEFLDRSCEEVFAEFTTMGVALPQPEPCEAPRVKNLSWYDRRRKILLGDWQDHTITHAHQRRENLEPCSHDGPCAPRVCSCVNAGVMCEKFCRCTVDECAYKFTGCACHSQGQTCQQNRKDRPCICVQLNRECDPQLCESCGVLERADPLNAGDDDLHATGCQNCDLQRGTGKSLLLGQSQLEGCGYGLFTAEPIAQDEFVIEYVGELITHDEGVRREARRGDVFDEESNVSYVFTLLENEGIWVDAAIYGNLSRYINHASEHDTRGCNITPRILYVNGEYRIKFTAMRDIEAGEELFFNYGENFPNLTKKLLDDKAARKPETGKARGTRMTRSEADHSVPPKAMNLKRKRGPGRPRVKRDVPSRLALHTGAGSALGRSRRRKRRRLGDEAETEEGEEEQEEGEGEGVGAEEATRQYDAAFNSTVQRKGASSRQADGSEQDAAGSCSAVLSRPRRASQKHWQSETPAKRSELPKKTRGKRGGARPGSGRPRKHPRPVPPKPVFDDYDFPDDSPRWPTKPPMVSAAGPGPAAAAAAAAVATIQGSSRNMPTTPEPKRPTRRSDRSQVTEIQDSDDEAEDVTRAFSIPSGRRRDGHGHGNEDEMATTTTTTTTTQHGKDKDKVTDDAEDEDVRLPLRSNRAARIRRLPAKFRDEDIWN